MKKQSEKIKPHICDILDPIFIEDCKLDFDKFITAKSSCKMLPEGDAKIRACQWKKELYEKLPREIFETKSQKDVNNSELSNDILGRSFQVLSAGEKILEAKDQPQKHLPESAAHEIIKEHICLKYYDDFFEQSQCLSHFIQYQDAVENCQKIPKSQLDFCHQKDILRKALPFDKINKNLKFEFGTGFITTYLDKSGTVLPGSWFDIDLF